MLALPMSPSQGPVLCVLLVAAAAGAPVRVAAGVVPDAPPRAATDSRGSLAATDSLAGGSVSGAPTPGVVAPGSIARAAASQASAEDLGPTRAKPWNPPRPAPDAERWEQVVRLPGRIVSYPISGLGYVVRHQLTQVEGVSLVPKVEYVLLKSARLGLIVTPASLGDRTGLGGALKLSPIAFRHVVSASLEGSMNGYDRTRVALAFGPLSVSYGYEWRPRERFYGIGLQSSHDSVSTYAAQSEDARVAVTYPWRRAGQPPRAQAGVWAGPRRMVVRTGREEPSFDSRFPVLTATQLDAPLDYLAYGARLMLDRRNGEPHWSRGFRIAGEAVRFDRPVRALALRDARGAAVQFTRYMLEAEGGVSFMRDPRTLRLALRVLDNRPTTSGAVLLEDLAELGGARGLSGFEPGRFHDLGLVLGRLSYVFPLAEHFEFDLHAEAGGVYPDVWKDARLKTLKNSYGVALRPRTRSAPLGAVGVDWSAETVRLRYSIGGVE